jgi:protein translocase SEC61 complex gamma subunit
MAVFMNVVSKLNVVSKFKKFITNSKHVLNISYRPTNEEFKRSAKIIILGIIAIGVVGFVIGVIISFVTTGILIPFV